MVAILDADKEGFLRSETSLVQTIGRAARNAQGTVIMYADQVTDSMGRAISETNRRRKIQMDYNKEHGIVPKTIIKGVRDVIEATTAIEEEPEVFTEDETAVLIEQLKEEMRAAAAELDFERAAALRDRIMLLEKEK